jgi:hypothetical protein
MGDNTGNTKANAGSTSRLYVILPPLYAIMLQMLILVIGPDLLLLKTLFLEIYLDLVLFRSLLACMTSLISNLVMFYMLLLWIKLWGKLFIFPTRNILLVFFTL